MNPEPASSFFTILTLFAWVATVAVVGLRVTRGLSARTGARPDALARFLSDVSRAALPIAWLVATVATLGSLYYSEIENFTPCKLCWYQRIAMYPFVLLLGIATFRRDVNVRIYVIAQAAAGASVSVYHSWIQWFPPEGGTSFCTLDAPCTQRFVFEIGFVTLPFMALTAFVLIAVLMSTIPAGGSGRSDPRGDPRWQPGPEHLPEENR